MVDFKGFKLEAVNDNFDKSIESYESYDEMAQVLAQRFNDAARLPDMFPPEETFGKVINRTNSISALVELNQRLKGASLSKLASSCIDGLLKPGAADIQPGKQFQNLPIDDCVDAVLGRTLDLLLNSTPLISKAWLANYLPAERMRADIQVRRAQVIRTISQLEGWLDVIRNESQKRLELLNKVNNT